MITKGKLAAMGAAALAALIALPHRSRPPTGQGAARGEHDHLVPVGDVHSSHLPARRPAHGPDDPGRQDHAWWKATAPATPTSSTRQRSPRCASRRSGLEDGPAGVADGLTGVTQLPAGVVAGGQLGPVAGPAVRRRSSAPRSSARAPAPTSARRSTSTATRAGAGPSRRCQRGPVPQRRRWTCPRSTASRARTWRRRSSTTTPTTRRRTATPPPTTSSSPTGRCTRSTCRRSTRRSTQAHAASVMCAYSCVNGNASCNNSLPGDNRPPGPVGLPRLRDVGLRRAALHRRARSQGTDQEQPFNTYYGAALQTAIQNGTIPRQRAQHDGAARAAPRCSASTCSPSRAPARPRTRSPPRRTRRWPPQVAEAGHHAAEERRQARCRYRQQRGTVAVIGPSASASPTYAGGGSAYVIPSARRSRPLAGIQAAAGSGTTHLHARACRPTPLCRLSRPRTCRPRTPRRRSAAATRARSPRRRPAPTCWRSPTRAAATPPTYLTPERHSRSSTTPAPRRCTPTRSR